MTTWGASGPYQKVYEKFGITGSSAFLVSSLLWFQVADKGSKQTLQQLGRKLLPFTSKGVAKSFHPSTRLFELEVFVVKERM